MVVQSAQNEFLKSLCSLSNELTRPFSQFAICMRIARNRPRLDERIDDGVQMYNIARLMPHAQSNKFTFEDDIALVGKNGACRIQS